MDDDLQEGWLDLWPAPMQPRTVDEALPVQQTPVGGSKADWLALLTQHQLRQGLVTQPHWLLSQPKLLLSQPQLTPIMLTQHLLSRNHLLLLLLLLTQHPKSSCVWA